jgi:hypothetical protein
MNNMMSEVKLTLTTLEQIFKQARGSAERCFYQENLPTKTGGTLGKAF